ncbi:MAG: right-handed parallel beta-helix repeat-containing protein, partial [Armatimonadota bacterium]
LINNGSNTIGDTQLHTSSGFPYVIDDLSVPLGKTLTVDPGCIIKFRGSLNVYGSIIAKGTAALPITFTSYKDDTVGGDTDNESATPNPGNWGNVLISGTGATGSFEHCVVRYGGGAYGVYANLGCRDGGVISVNNCTITNSWRNGLYAHSSTITTSGSIVKDCETGVYIENCNSANITGYTVNNCTYGMMAENCKDPTFTTNTVINNNSGIRINNSTSPTLTNNIFKDNYACAAQISGNISGAITLQGNNATGNAINGLLINNGSNTIGDTQLHTSSGFPYVIDDLSVPLGKTLTVDPGCIVKLRAFLNVYGSITAKGTAALPITFTSYKDDTVGGDTDNESATPAQGNWGSILISGAGATGSFENCVVRYGGGYGVYANLGCRDSGVISVNNCTITDSSNFGLYSYSSTASIKNSIISYCAGSGVAMSGVVSMTYTNTWQNGGADTLAGEVTSMGNIHADPKFVSLQAGDLRLGNGSPCIDTGDPQLLDTDGTRSDMGALVATGIANLASLVVTVNPGAGYIGLLNRIALEYDLSGPQTYTGELTLDSTGKARITGIQPGRYGLTIYGSHWLKRAVKNIDISQDTSLTVSLTNGDADGDNQVNLFDFVVLDTKFNSSDHMADLDGSGQVNLFDYVIIDQNFGAQGD